MSNSHYNLRARLSDRAKPFLFTWMIMSSQQLAGQIARLPFDGVCLDMQHGMIDFGDAAAMIAAINAAQRPAIVRVLWNEPGLIGQVLDAGAAAVIVPMVNSVADAEKLVRVAKYPPLGQRSWGGYGAVQAAGLNAGDYLQQANGMIQIFAMIETAAALDLVDEIAAVPGLDGLFVGPSDLSIALSNGAGIDKTSPSTVQAMQKVAAAAKKNNLVAGAFAGSADTAKVYLQLGYTFIAATVDMDILQTGAKAVLAALQDM